MTHNKENNTKLTLRSRAEKLLAKAVSQDGDADKNKLLHELSVHQIELEIQNQELYKSQAEQKKALKRYTNLFSGAPISYFVINRDMEIISSNKKAHTILNKNLSYLAGTRLTDYIDDVKKIEFTESIIKTFSDGKSRALELLLTVDKNPLWVESEIKSDDTEGVVLLTMKDITHRKAHEVSMKLFAAVYESLSEAVVVVDKSKNIISINRSFTALTGYNEKEILGRAPDILLSNKHNHVFYNKILNRLEICGSWSGEMYLRRKDDSVFYTRLSINSIYNDEGEATHRVAAFADISEQKLAADTIARQANYDLLTGLPNRVLFYDRLQQEVKKATRTNRMLALLCFDIDHFKEVNDSFGHPLGDSLLKDIAARVGECLRDGDTFARPGGDEFSIIMNDITDLIDIRKVAERILSAMSKPFALEESFISVSISIGVSVYPNDAPDVTSLIRDADNAMYTAKNSGRNCLHFFTPLMQKKLNRRLRLSKELRGVIAKDQLFLEYQPVVELSSRKIVKAEALLRWRHPELGIISPGEFIPIAEENGQIISIGDWVFRQATQRAQEWRKRHNYNLQISINKSPAQFKHTKDIEGWFTHLKRLGLPGNAVVLEITEGLLMDARENINQQFSQYNDAGFEIAIDDFGTGYSSLAYLKKFHVDYIKIDRSFVNELSPHSNDIALCEAMIVMAHKLGLKVVAEGIETNFQWEQLKKVDCDYGQGYFFSKPISAENFDIALAGINYEEDLKHSQ